MGKGRLIRERYEATAKGYDELYRAEQYEKYAATLRRVPPHGTVLDAGCGTGLLAEYMRATGLLDRIDTLICLDYSRAMLEIARWRLQIVCPGKCVTIEANVENIPLADKSVDVTYSFTVLDLVDDLLGAVEELRRVTRGPVIASLLKKLPYKDKLIMLGAEIVAVTSKDVVLRLDSEGYSKTSTVPRTLT